MAAPSPTVHELEQRFPDGTRAECERFLESFSNEAAERLDAYLNWRQAHHRLQYAAAPAASSSFAHRRTDETDWETVVTEAVNTTLTPGPKHPGLIRGPSETSKQERKPRRHRLHRRSRRFQDNNGKESTTAEESRGIPQLLFCHYLGDSRKPLVDLTGHCIIQHLPAQIDIHAVPFETYATAFALYLDCKLNRTDKEKLTLLIDVRPGKGWPNTPALQLVGFIRFVVRELQNLYPCRLHKCIVYPVPKAAIYIWHAIRGFLDPFLTELIVLVAGGAAINSPPPNKALGQFVDAGGLDLLEKTRVDAFAREDDDER